MARVAPVPRAPAGSQLAGIAFRPLPESPIQSESWCMWRAGATVPGVIETFLPKVRAVTAA